ncbi:hypothetical protein GGR52DRAFT_562740 [Hypoxylon sp. FL1284]|nr:hypothetical protein GGR52DRAFT_562740 [Hypoxylon sp. FL1284]
MLPQRNPARYQKFYRKYGGQASRPDDLAPKPGSERPSPIQVPEADTPSLPSYLRPYNEDVIMEDAPDPETPTLPPYLAHWDEDVIMEDAPMEDPAYQDAQPEAMRSVWPTDDEPRPTEAIPSEPKSQTRTWSEFIDDCRLWLAMADINTAQFLWDRLRHMARTMLRIAAGDLRLGALVLRDIGVLVLPLVCWALWLILLFSRQPETELGERLPPQQGGPLSWAEVDFVSQCLRDAQRGCRPRWRYAVDGSAVRLSDWTYNCFARCWMFIIGFEVEITSVYRRTGNRL